MQYQKQQFLTQLGREIQVLRENTKPKLTQHDVSNFLKVSQKSIYYWEAGRSSPTAAHLKDLIKLFLLYHAFSEETEIEALLNLTHDLSLDIDKAWLHAQLQIRSHSEQPLDPPAFYGRENELRTLEQWICQQGTRLVTIFGVGGIGKTTLAAKITHQLVLHFDEIIWQSLQNPLSVDDLVVKCIQILLENPSTEIPVTLERQMTLLLDLLRKRRCLIIFDNFENVLSPQGPSFGIYRSGYEGYQTFLDQIVQTDHQSCLLLTSRELPDVRNDARLRLLRLESLDILACRKMLSEKDLRGTDDEWQQFVAMYGGNPLTLKIIAEEVRELVDSTLGLFLRQNVILTYGIRQLLARQFQRISLLEQSLLTWLAIAREPKTLEELEQYFKHTVVKGTLIDAVSSLRRRCLIERGPQATFTLQSDLLEYVTELLLDRLENEMLEMKPGDLVFYPLLNTQAKEDIRKSQVCFLLSPLLERLLVWAKGDKVQVEKHLMNLVERIRSLPQAQQGFSGGNLVNLLATLRGDLCGLNFSHLIIKQAVLEIPAQDVNFSGAHFEASTFTDTIGSIGTLAFSPDGSYLAAGLFNRQIRIWSTSAPLQLLQTIDAAHPFVVWRIAFGSDGSLISGGNDGEVKVWDPLTGHCLHVLPGHTQWIRSIAVSPTDPLFATASNDGSVRLWSQEACLRALSHASPVWSVAFSPDGTLLASATVAGEIKIWRVQTGECINSIMTPASLEAIAFSPDGVVLASADMDGKIIFWDTTGHCVNELQAHAGKILCLAFHPAGTLLASGSHKGEVKVWKREGKHFAHLQTYQERGMVWSVTFSPNGRLLASGSHDGALQLRSIEAEEKEIYHLSTLRGYSHVIGAIAFSPNGSLVAYGDTKGIITLREVSLEHHHYSIQAHARADGRINGIAFSPDGTLLASGSDDQTIKVWNVSTGQCLRTFLGHGNNVWSVAFSPDGTLLASGCLNNEINLWQVSTGHYLRTLRGHTGWVWPVTFSPDGTLLASGSMKGEIMIWQVESGQCLKKVVGSDPSPIIALRFDGHHLISSSDREMMKVIDVVSGQCLSLIQGSEANWIHTAAIHTNVLACRGSNETIKIVDLHTGQCLHTCPGGPGDTFWSVAFSPDGTLLACGDDHGALRLFGVPDGKLLSLIRSRDRPYERMEIHGTNLSDAQKAALMTLGAIDNAATLS